MVSRTDVGTRMGQAAAWGPAATGRRERRDGADWIVCERRLRSPLQRVWSLFTDPDQAATWLGTWRRSDDGVGLDFRALGEESTPIAYTMSRLEPPRLLEIAMRDPQASGAWTLRVELHELDDGGTRVVLSQSVAKPSLAPSVGAACDFYLDRLVLVEGGEDLTGIDYDDYFVVQAEHYRRLFPVQRTR